MAGVCTPPVRVAGKGSTFYFTLPVQSSAEDKPVQTASSPSSITHTALRHRVLVVDDNVDSADSLQALLEVMGHTARSAYEPLHALVIAEEFAPQIVVLDLGLPGMHGLELTRRLHALPQTANATLIALTGYGQSEDIERTQAAGIAYHLIKPVDIAVLQDVLNRL
jgi:CheY-like chemotaxis protein